MSVSEKERAGRPVRRDVGLDWRSRIDERLREMIPAQEAIETAAGAKLREASGYATLAPGKRLRSTLVLAAASDLGASSEAALDCACAIELVHAASLVLDDLPCMDDAAMRRGRPTLHRAFGEGTAILTAIAIAMMNERYRIVLRPGDGRGPERVAVLAEAIGPEGLVAGQIADLDFLTRSALEVETVYARKTGALFVAACRLACVLAGADDITTRSLDGFAESAGLAFQIGDDDLDANADPKEIGKDVAKDDSRATLRRAVGVDASRSRRDRSMRDARAFLALVKADGELSRWLSLVSR